MSFRDKMSIIKYLTDDYIRLGLLLFVATFLILSALPRLESIGIVKFTRSDRYNKETVDISQGYYDVYRAIEMESKKSDAIITELSVNSFREYFGDNVTDRDIELYRLIIAKGLADIVFPYTVSSVYRNHFPDISDTVAVRIHVERITNVALALNSGYIDSVWDLFFPELDRYGYRAYMKNALFSDILSVKSQALVNIEQRKLEIINNLVARYPRYKVCDIKNIWAMRRGER